MDLDLLRALTCGNGDRIMKVEREKPILFSGRSLQGNTALHIASRSSVNKKTVFQEILNKQPSLLYERNDRGETPLLIAAAAGHVNIVKLFDEKIKSTDNETGQENILMRMQDNEDNTALHIAVRYGHLKVVQELTAVDPEPLLYVNRAGQSPLSITIDEKLTDIACWIMRKNSDSLNYEGSNQLTVLYSVVIRQNFASGHVKIAERLSKVLLAHKRDSDGQTPLHLATKNGRLGVMKMFVKDYPDVIELLNSKKRNILHLAAECGHDNIVSFILNLPDKDNFINAPDEDGNIPLHLAAMYFRYNVIKNLSRDRKLNIKATNHNLQTAIAIAQTSKMKATENKKCLTLKALEDIYKNRDLDPEDIIANWALDERIILLTLTTLVAAFTFTAALTIPANYKYPKFLKFDRNYKGTGFGIFIVSIAASSASCLSAAATICWLFLRASNNHEYFIKTLPSTVLLTFCGLVSMALAFVSGLYLVLSDNQTIPTQLVWYVSAATLFFHVFIPTYIWFLRRVVSC
ncbi:hypothetical protein ACOSQ2_030836 [Xanthoceras sorbifolium]